LKWRRHSEPWRALRQSKSPADSTAVTESIRIRNKSIDLPPQLGV
jgi:hypothetical protein